MPGVGFESTIPVSERAKTVHALDRTATVTGHGENYVNKINQILFQVITSDNSSLIVF
jgi:hypothetical protein